MYHRLTWNWGKAELFYNIPFITYLSLGLQMKSEGAKSV
jgi:hypothetical protein